MGKLLRACGQVVEGMCASFCCAQRQEKNQAVIFNYVQFKEQSLVIL